MTVRISTVQTANVPGDGAILARVNDDDIHIWPQGVGIGPIITMSRDDWRRITREVALALSRADREKDHE